MCVYLRRTAGLGKWVKDEPKRKLMAIHSNVSPTIHWEYRLAHSFFPSELEHYQPVI
jgi:hypothetical protein